MRFSTAAAMAALVLACSAAPTSGSRYNLHEKRDGQPHAWQKRHRAVADQVLPIRIALKQRNLENAADYIYDVADPSSPNFGKPGSRENSRSRALNEVIERKMSSCSVHNLFVSI